MRKIISSLLLLAGLIGNITLAQNTLGVITYEDSLVEDGYNLLYPHNQSYVYLLDNCGRIVHTWQDAPNKSPGNIAYIQPNGNLVRASRDNSIAGDPIWAGGGGEFIEILDWDNNLLWTFELEDSLFRLHHDIRVMPNGHILAIAWERHLQAEALAAGRDPNRLPDGEVWGEKIIELEPVGATGFNIVWEWSLWDHLIQDIDTSKANYGVVANHPELVDLNFGDAAKDWVHLNSIDYNADLDQILVSAPTFNEIWIIDHSTTTIQAAGHSGGLSGRGGDLLWRWGNPMAYGRGDSTHTQLHFQHDAHWVDKFLAPGSDPDYGKILVFNNRYASDHSAVHVLEPQFDTYDWEYLFAGSTFAPALPSWTYTRPTPTDFYSPIVSGAQRLENGNTLILSGQSGYAFEITPSGQIVWEFRNPLVNGTPANNGDTLVLSANLVFRFNRYPADFAGFSGRNLAPGNYLTPGADSTLCPMTIGIEEPVLSQWLKAFPNPAQDQLQLVWEGPQAVPAEIWDATGQLRWRGQIHGTTQTVSTQSWASGLYLLRVQGRLAQRLLIQH